MGDWRAVGEDLIDTYFSSDEDMQELSQLIHDRIGCSRCKAFELCDEYKDDAFDGECWKVLNSFFADKEEEDTREVREEREREAEIQNEEDWHSWYYRDQEVIYDI